MNLNFLKNLLLKGKLTVEGSTEIGTSNEARGTSSFAQGSDALASGLRSFAQGLEVTASGDGSHAEGYGTVASGLNSHAEGIETDATGDSSHTEGNNTSASGINTHAEGNLTVASGDNSHAEGYLTAATALGSHAEGNRTATGKRINYSTYTYSTQVFTFTPDTSAEFNYVTPGTVLRGYDTDVLSNYFAFTVLNRSTVTGNITAVEDVIGGNSNIGFIINNSGEYAHVEGFESIASGLYSHAEGDYTEASGEASHTEGSYTIASGNRSHAEGSITVASGNNSHAEGRYSEAKGNTSHAAGCGATAGHNYSYVWSDGELGTREPNLSSTREGQYVIDAIGGVYIPRNVGIGTDSIDNALTVVGTISTSNHGNSNQWNQAYSLVQSNSASWEESADILPTVTNYLSTNNVLISGLNITNGLTITGIISGNNLRTSFNQGSAIGDYSFAEGKGTASGFYSHAEGEGTIAYGDYSHAEGYSTKALGAFGSHAEGEQTIAQGSPSHSEGGGTIASGNYSHAEGAYTFAFGFGGHTEGSATTTGQPVTFSTYSSATRTFTFFPQTSGLFNSVFAGSFLVFYKDGTGYLFREVESRNNNNGNITLINDPWYEDIDTSTFVGQAFVLANANNGGHAEGSFTFAYGEGSHAEGSGSIASNQGSHAEGTTTIASGVGSHSEGFITIASGSNSHSEGYNTEAKGSASHAEGVYTVANGEYSHAAGTRATAAQDYTYAWSDGNLGTLTENVSTTRTGQYMVSASGGVFIPGKVGIGTDSIANALTVVGNLSATGTGTFNTIALSSVTFTGETKTSTTSVTATDAYIKVIANGQTKYLRLFDVI